MPTPKITALLQANLSGAPCDVEWLYKVRYRCLNNSLQDKKQVPKSCNVWVEWLGRRMIVTLLSTAAWSSKMELQWVLWSSKSRMIFLEALCLRECTVNDLLNYSVLIFDDFWFVHTSNPRRRASPNSCFLLTPLNTKTGGRNWPAKLQHAFTLIFPPYSLDVNSWTFLDPFSVITVSGLFICMLLLPMFQMFSCVSERLFLSLISPAYWKVLKQFSDLFFGL